MGDTYDEDDYGPIPHEYQVQNGDFDSHYSVHDDQSDDHGEQPRYLNDLARGRAAYFYINGNVFFPSRKIVHNPKHFKDFPHYLDYLTEKLDPRFGAVRKICTPSRGHRVRDVRDIQENGVYVVAGRERFRPYQYDQITPTERKKSPPFNYNADPVYHSRMFVSSGKINKCETHSILIKVWPNGGDLRGPRRVLLTPRVRPFTLPNVISHVNEVLKEDCLGTVEKLYFLNGVKVSDVDQINANGQYVACRRTERFKRARYSEQGTKNLSTSPRLERKFLAPLYPRSDNSTSQSSPEHSNASTQNSVNSYSNRRKAHRRDDEDQVFPAKPVKHTRSSEKVRTVDLDKDQGGVFKAKNNNRNTRGAREIQDSRHTKTDLPVDQREAREVEEERIKGRDNRKEYHQRNGYPRGGVEPKANSRRAPPANDKIVDGYANQREQSAVKIQAGYRGYKTRKQLNRQQQRHQSTPRQNGHLSPGNGLDEEERAAAKIQAGFRGHRTRKELSRSPRRDSHAAWSPPREATPPKRNSPSWDDRDEAARKIQAGYRGHMVRQELASQPSQDEELAASKIQAGYRGFKTRKELRENQVSHSPGQEERERAASKIQAGYRGHQSRQEMRAEPTLYQEELAATKIQAGFRGHQTRRRLKEENEAAAKIQAGYRGHQSRQQSPQRDSIQTPTDNMWGDEEQAAAKIQAGYRGYMSRKQTSELKKAQQPTLAREGTYDELDKENEAALKIQSHYRGYRTRKDINSQDAGAVKSPIQSISPPLVSSDKYNNEVDNVHNHWENGNTHETSLSTNGLNHSSPSPQERPVTDGTETPDFLHKSSSGTDNHSIPPEGTQLRRPSQVSSSAEKGQDNPNQPAPLAEDEGTVQGAEGAEGAKDEKKEPDPEEELIAV